MRTGWRCGLVLGLLVVAAGARGQSPAGLSERTAVIAKRTYLFDPDQTWKKVDATNP